MLILIINNPPTYSMIQDFYMKDMSTQSVESIITYYESRFGGKFSPPETTINSLAYRFLESENKQDKLKALKLFQLNSVNYPKSPNAFDSLAEAYLKKGDNKNALQNYKIALTLNPKSKNLKQVIKELENK